MKARIGVLLAVLLLGAGLFGPRVIAAEFSPALEYELSKAQSSDFVSAIVILESPIDIRALDERLHVEKATKARRHGEVLAALHYNAESTQPKVRAEFDQAVQDGVMKGYTPYWIENLFVINATKDFIDGMRNRGDIKFVTENFRPVLIEPIRPTGEKAGVDHSGRNPLDTRTLAIGIQEVGALRVNEELGITGNGVLVGDCDTGTDATHPALSARWRGNFAPWWQCWKDNVNHTSQVPSDGNGHGTHTMGTMTGRGVSGTDTTWVGCAPSARWISNNAISMNVGRTLDNEVIASYQWFTDPDTVGHSLAAVPDVINNSWGTYANIGGDPVYTQCYAFWNTVILNAEAASIVVIFAAGNESTSGLRSPAIYSMNSTQIFATGAVDGTTNPTPPYPIASFSSLGPTPCTPANPNNIKPEVSAPGVNVLSSIPGGTYTNGYSGTSMATPHVSGIVALMREACPDCDPTTIKMAIENTAIRTGYVTPPATENNTFGNGFVDGYAAVLAVSNLGRIGGIIRDAASNPIAGATVANAGGAQNVLSDATGHYYLPLSAGTYSIRYSKFGYVTQTIPGLVVIQGDTTIQNVTLQLAPVGIVHGLVTSCAGGPAIGALVEILTTGLSATTNNAGNYSISNVPQGTYDMRASGAGCGTQTVTGVAIGANTTQNFTLPSDPRFLCSAPDGGGYIACENGDANGPTYNWFEVSPTAGGPGTIAAISGDDMAGALTIPFTFRMYGTNYTSVNACTNGFLTFDALQTTYSEVCPLPYASFGHAIFLFWDDMYVDVGQDISYYYNTAENAFIIEWRNIRHYSGTGNETFQVWLYNVATNPSPTGDSQIKIQYQTLSATITSCGVGVQSGAVANPYVCDGTLDPNAQGLTSGRVICYGGCNPPIIGTLAGLITMCTGGPAANAAVSFPGSFYPSITADATGHYTQNVVPGTYSVRADKVGCTYARQDNNVVTANHTTTVNLTLRAPTGIQGTITSCTGGPSVGAIVTFPGSTLAACTTDVAGHYLRYCDAGTYSVRADKAPCTYIQQDNNVVALLQMVTVNLTLRAPTGIQGTVTDCAGGPSVGAIVTFPSSTLAPCTTSATGAYLRYCNAGTYNVHAAKSTCSDADSPNHPVAEAQIITVNMTLGAPGILQGMVTSCVGGPAVGATVTLIGTGRPPATTNGAGFYQFTGLPAATYNMATLLSGCWPDTGSAVVTSGNTTTRNITLISNPALSCSAPDSGSQGYVACENGDPGGPTFNWRAIAPSEGGPGTLVTGLLDDNFVSFPTLPFTIKFMGVNYTSLNIGSNGYVTFPEGTGNIPNACPPLTSYSGGVYFFACDMYPPLGGQVATYFNAADHTFTIEYYQINHYSAGPPETFEVIFYDPAFYPTATGDADFVFQYNTAASISNVYVWIMNGTVTTPATRTLTYKCGATLPPHSQNIAVGRAVRFSTGPGCQGAPNLVETPASITKSVPLNGTTSDSVHICNTGVCPLTWSLAYHQITPALVYLEAVPFASPNVPKDVAEGRLMEVAKVDKTIVVDNAGHGRNQLDNQGGPDIFGYRWKDSNEPAGPGVPTYNWVELAAIGQNTGLTGDDQGIAFPLPFQFTYYGNTFNSVWICTNGFLQMGTTGTTPWTEMAIPSTSAPTNMIAPFWDDMYLPGGGGNVYYYNDVANNRFIVQYDSMPHITNYTYRYTYEVLLYADGHIVFQYQNMSGPVNSCTVGQQNQGGTDGLQVVYDAAYIVNNLAIQFQTVPPVPQWCSIQPPFSGQVAPNQCTYVHLNFNSAGLAAGQYTGTLTLTNNDQAHNPTTIPLTFIVGTLDPPQQLTLYYDPTANQLLLRWLVTGAPAYRIYSATQEEGPYTNLVGSSNTNSFTTPYTGTSKLFYVVTSWDGTAAESAPSQPVRLGSR